MSKIKPIKKEFYDFIDMCDEINKVLGYDQRAAGKHFFPDSEDRITWHKRKGHDCNSKDPEYNVNITKEYEEAIKNGETKKTPYLDFWHWQLDNCVNDDFRNDSYGYVNIHPECASNAKDWQKEIQQVWYDTFKDIADENGIVNIWICW